jgi:hypothetical protein
MKLTLEGTPQEIQEAIEKLNGADKTTEVELETIEVDGVPLYPFPAYPYPWWGIYPPYGYSIPYSTTTLGTDALNHPGTCATTTWASTSTGTPGNVTSKRDVPRTYTDDLEEKEVSED